MGILPTLRLESHTGFHIDYKLYCRIDFLLELIFPAIFAMVVASFPDHDLMREMDLCLHNNASCADERPEAMTAKAIIPASFAAISCGCSLPHSVAISVPFIAKPQPLM